MQEEIQKESSEIHKVGWIHACQNRVIGRIHRGFLKNLSFDRVCKLYLARVFLCRHIYRTCSARAL